MRNRIATSMLMAVLGVAATSAHADDYCCTCKNEKTGTTINASSRASAVIKCVQQCLQPGIVTAGKCEAASAAAPTAAAPIAATSVMLYRSEDCSGEPARVGKSTPNLKAVGIDGIRSMSLESGGPAAGWRKPDFGGRSTGYMAPTICVSPGFEIQSVRVGER
jgi:hypothetical protein